jgi:hypothetical protein
VGAEQAPDEDKDSAGRAALWAVVFGASSTGTVAHKPTRTANTAVPTGTAHWQYLTSRRRWWELCTIFKVMSAVTGLCVCVCTSK